MTCPNELGFQIYTDGELSGEALRDLETHLVACAACRARVLTLREESEMLARTLHDVQPSAGLAAEADAASPPGSLPAAVIASVLGLAALGAGVETWFVTQGGFELAPLSALRRGFDLLLLVRARVPGLFELLVAVAATASVSALATFALSTLARRLGNVAVVWTGTCIGFFAPGAVDPAQAFEVFRESRVVAADERVEGTLLGYGEEVTVHGVVAGDLWVAAERVTIDGHVQGNVWAAGDEVVFSGRLDGDLFAGAERLRVAGEVGGSAHLVGEDVIVDASAEITRDLRIAADTGRIAGRIGRDATAGVEALELHGPIGRNADVWAGELRIDPEASIAGDLWVALPRRKGLADPSSLPVRGETRIVSHRDLHADAHGRSYSDPGFYVSRLIRVCAAFLTGLLLYALVPGIFRPRFATARGFFRAAGFGLLALLLVPPLLLLVGVTLIGLPVAIACSFLFTVALYAAGILVAARVGDVILPPRGSGLRAFGLSLLAGLLALAVVSSLPFLGPAVHVLAVLAGLGLLVDLLRRGGLRGVVEARGAAG